MSTTPAIEICGLNYKLGNRYLLSEVHWTVAPGENWLIFGQNGSGKTTLLSIIAGFSRYTNGEVTILGQPYPSDDLLSIRQKIGFVSSSFYDNYYSNEVVLNVILSGFFGTLGLGARLDGTHIAKARLLLRQAGIEQTLGQPLSELSKGERQKVFIIRALIGDPQILLLDEPSTGLDVLAREQMLSMVRRLAKGSLTVIYVTHYVEEILDVFDHCLLLKQGRIYLQGLTEHLLTEDILSEFLDYPISLTKESGKYYLSLKTDRWEKNAT